MNTRTLALALCFATFAPMIAYAQKPPTAAPAEPTFTQIADPPSMPAPLVASPAPGAVLFAPVVMLPQTAATVPAVSMYPAPATPAAPTNEQVEGDLAPAPAGSAPSVAARPRSDYGTFRFAIDGGVTIWDSLDGNGSAELGQIGAFFGWTLTHGSERPDGRRPFGFDLGFAIRLDADDSIVVTRPQIAGQFAFPRIFGTLGVGFASAQSLEGSEPSLGVSLDVTIGWRVAGAFYLGVTSGMDAWLEGGNVRRSGLVLGFAVD